MKWADGKPRCRWADPNNERYLRYHDQEWGVPVHDDQKLFEMLILESFQAGLSWACVLNKRDAFRQAFDGFDLDAVCAYKEDIPGNSGGMGQFFPLPLALDRRPGDSRGRPFQLSPVRCGVQRPEAPWDDLCGHHNYLCLSPGGGRYLCP